MPITATYYAAVDNTRFDFENENKDVFGKEIQSEKIKNNIPIGNYAAFFGEGIPLYDNSLVFADENFYFGFVSQDKSLELTFNQPTSLDNGITIIFDKFSCSKIQVTYGGDLAGGKLVEDKSKPLVWYIPLLLDKEIQSLNIKFLDFAENEVLTLKGIVLGKIIEINNFFDFNYLSEVKPLGDDLPINEINSTAYLTENFYDEEGQKMVYYDNSNTLDETFVVDSEFEQKNHFITKSQNLISVFDKSKKEYAFDVFQEFQTADWSNLFITAKDALLSSGFSNDITFIYPDWFEAYKISPFLEPCTGRKILQQIAWACCCGIRTDGMSNTIEFVPFLNDGVVTPDIVISNEDNRTLKSKVSKGERYDKIVWEYSKYTKTQNLIFNEVIPTFVRETDDEIWNNEYFWSISFSKPTQFETIGISETTSSPHDISYLTPYGAGGSVYLNSETKQQISAREYTEEKRSVNIDLQSSSDKTLIISNQVLFPLDLTNKTNQIKKWYTKNNTLTATVVDNGDIELGKILKIQLENEEYFTGIITKIERNNVSDYHVLNVEAHEWD